MIIIAVGIIWLLCGVTCYRFMLPVTISAGESKAAVFVGSLAFWWVMLPVFVVRLAWLAAHESLSANQSIPRSEDVEVRNRQRVI